MDGVGWKGPEQFSASGKSTEEYCNELVNDPELDIDHLKILPRSDWGAVEPRPSRALETPVDTVLTTFTGTEPCSNDEDCIKLLRNLQAVQMEERGMPDIQWNFMVGGTGTVFEGRGFETMATKLPHYTQPQLNSLDIAYIGQNKADHLTKPMFASMNGLVSVAMEENFVVENFKYSEETASREIYQPFILQK